MYREGACSGKVIWSPFIRFRVREGNRSPCCSLSPITSLPGFHVYRISASRAQEIIIPRPHRRGKHVTVEKIAKRCASPDTGLYHYENTNSSFPRKRESRHPTRRDRCGLVMSLDSRFRGSDGWGQRSFAIFSYMVRAIASYEGADTGPQGGNFRAIAHAAGWFAPSDFGYGAMAHIRVF